MKRIYKQNELNVWNECLSEWSRGWNKKGEFVIRCALVYVWLYTLLVHRECVYVIDRQLYEAKVIERRRKKREKKKKKEKKKKERTKERKKVKARRKAYAPG